MDAKSLENVQWSVLVRMNDTSKSHTVEKLKATMEEQTESVATADKEVQPFTMTLRRRPANIPELCSGAMRSSATVQSPRTPSLSKSSQDLEPSYATTASLEDVPMPTTVPRSRSCSSSSVLSDLHYTPEKESQILESMRSQSSETKHKLSYHGREVPGHWIPPLNPLSKKVYPSMDRSLYREPEIKVKTWQERVKEYDEICKEKDGMEREKGVGQRSGPEKMIRISSILELRNRILGNRGKVEKHRSTKVGRSIRLGDITYPPPPDSLSRASSPAMHGTNTQYLQESFT